MRFESRIFTLAKDAESPHENQDACRVDADGLAAAIADGVSSAIFSRAWAHILTEAVLADPLNPEEPEPLARWLAARRQTWSSRIDASQLSWFQKPKLRDGAFTTLLWVRPVDKAHGSPHVSTCLLRAFAIGDSCLFHVRGGALLAKFPIGLAAEFEAHPTVIGSIDLKHDDRLAFHRLDLSCLPGDLIVLSTDAIGEWALRKEEEGHAPAWEVYWGKTEDAWREEIMALRAERQIRFDDTTVALLRIVDDPPAQRQTFAKSLEEVSEELSGQALDQIIRGAEKLREAGETVRSALRKQWDRLRRAYHEK